MTPGSPWRIGREFLCFDVKNNGQPTMNIIEQLEKEQMAAVTAKRIVPDFSPGDTVKVMVRVAEEVDTPAKGKAKGAKKEEPKVSFRLGSASAR